MATYWFSDFDRNDNTNFSAILHGDDDYEIMTVAREFFRPNIIVSLCQNVRADIVVPEDCKEKLLTDAELNARIPQLLSLRRSSRRQRA